MVASFDPPCEKERCCMSRPDAATEAARWLRYAREDLAAAEAVTRRESVAARHVCWLAQQAAEKTIKAALVFLQIDVPRTHDLDALRNLLPDEWQRAGGRTDLAALTEWAVEARYPGEWPDATAADASSALETARQVLAAVANDLGAHGFAEG